MLTRTEIPEMRYLFEQIVMQGSRRVELEEADLHRLKGVLFGYNEQSENELFKIKVQTVYDLKTAKSENPRVIYCGKYVGNSIDLGLSYLSRVQKNQQIFIEVVDKQPTLW